MKVLVAVKRVVDFNVKVRIKPDGSDVDIAGVKMGINPFDENAVEEALRLKERGKASEVVAVSLGGSVNQDVLRHALAMGVDRAILVETDAVLQPLGVAKLLKAVVEREQPDLIILGKQAIDSDAGQTGQMLAALLGVGQGVAISAIEVWDEEIVVTREIDGGTETLALRLPAVITADLRLNEPRYVKLPNLMMAKKKPIQTLAAAELGVDAGPRLTQRQVADPPARKAGSKVASVQELVEKLRVEAKVLP
ncbi:MAG: electron transfer flavoprotein subunit beta/FixA family protein [Pseudomonadota bacterium]